MPHKAFVVAVTRTAIGFIAAISLTSLTGCGDGGTPTSTPAGTTITASFSGETLPSGVAYQVGTTGTFQSLTISRASASFTLPSGTDAYGFAYVCPTFLDGY